MTETLGLDRKFKIGPPEVTTWSQTLAYNSAHMIRMFLGFCFMSLLICVNLIIQSPKRPDYGLILGLCFLFIVVMTLGVSHLFYRKIRNYAFSWFRLTDHGIQIATDSSFKNVEMEIPYSLIRSFHRFSFFMRDRHFFWQHRPKEQFAFMRIQWGKLFGAEFGLDLGPKNAEEFELLISEIQKRSPDIQIREGVSSIRGVLYTF